LALLFKVGIKSENHTASILLLKELFGLDNSKILNAKKERMSFTEIEKIRNKFKKMI